MQPDTGVKTWQWVVTVIVVIVLIIIGIMVFGNRGSDAPADNSPAGTNNTPNQAASSIIMSDQYPGNVVYVSSVQLQSPGWVAIHGDTNGQPGAIIGQVYVPAGVSPARVTLTTPIIDGGTYYAMLHSDNGDQRFDATVDLPLKDANGNIIMRVFHGSVTADSNIKG